ncbi:hypothetical protein Mapa_010350 [Marchantia paleacea]|nr:hypothetical protein Mapa_010350 [Marchantia paleacea]
MMTFYTFSNPWNLILFPQRVTLNFQNPIKSGSYSLLENPQCRTENYTSRTKVKQLIASISIEDTISDCEE